MGRGADVCGCGRVCVCVCVQWRGGVRIWPQGSRVRANARLVEKSKRRDDDTGDDDWIEKLKSGPAARGGAVYGARGARDMGWRRCGRRPGRARTGAVG